MKKLLMLLPLLVACNTTIQKRQIRSQAPSWVKTVRDGGSLKIKYGRETYFRNTHTSNKTGSALCEEAVDKNVQNIKRAYPTLSKIPMTVKVVYYDPIVKDCATTVSVDTTLVNQIKKEVKKKIIKKPKLSKLAKLNKKAYCGMPKRKYERLAKEQSQTSTNVYRLIFQIDDNSIQETTQFFRYGTKNVLFSRTIGYLGYCPYLNAKKCFDEQRGFGQGHELNLHFEKCIPQE